MSKKNKIDFAGMLADFVRRYPGCFFPQGSECKPLAIGTNAELVADNPNIKPYVIGCFLFNYTRRLRYQRALATGGARYGLDGNSQGEVTPEEQAQAKIMIEAMLATAKEKHAATIAKAKAAHAAKKVSLLKSNKAHQCRQLTVTKVNKDTRNNQAVVVVTKRKKVINPQHRT